MLTPSEMVLKQLVSRLFFVEDRFEDTHIFGEAKDSGPCPEGARQTAISRCSTCCPAAMSDIADAHIGGIFGAVSPPL